VLGNHLVHRGKRMAKPPFWHECIARTNQRPPFRDFFRRISSSVLVDSSERSQAISFFLIYNKVQMEWGSGPVNFFNIRDVKQLLEYAQEEYPHLIVVYIRHVDKMLADEAFTLGGKKQEMSDEELVKPLADDFEGAPGRNIQGDKLNKLLKEEDETLRNFRLQGGKAIRFEDLVEPVLSNVDYGDLPRLTLINALQSLILANTDVACSVQGGLQHLIAVFQIPEIFVLNIRGEEFLKGEYACQAHLMHGLHDQQHVKGTTADVLKQAKLEETNHPMFNKHNSSQVRVFLSRTAWRSYFHRASPPVLSTDHDQVDTCTLCPRAVPCPGCYKFRFKNSHNKSMDTAKRQILAEQNHCHCRVEACCGLLSNPWWHVEQVVETPAMSGASWSNNASRWEWLRQETRMILRNGKTNQPTKQKGMNELQMDLTAEHSLTKHALTAISRFFHPK